MEVSTFSCSICGDPSRKICVYCTNDACSNHLCERCHRCSDCCQCEVRRSDPDSLAAPPPELEFTPVEEAMLVT